MLGKYPYFPMYVDDFASDGKVEAMTTEEVGAYILLLCKAWKEKPCGTIPNDDAVLARWARLDPLRWAECKPHVLDCFTLRNGRWEQKRMMVESAKLRKRSESLSEAGKRGVQARLKPGLSEAQARAYDSPSLPNSEGLGVQGERGIPPPRSNLPADNPELVSPARKLADRYAHVVTAAHSRGAAVETIIGLLNSGRSVGDLERCMDGYAASCTAASTGAKFRLSATKFFQTAGEWEKFVDYRPPPPAETAAEYRARMDAEAAEGERNRQETAAKIAARRKAKETSG